MKSGRRAIFSFLVLVVLAGCAHQSQLVYQIRPISVAGQKDVQTVRQSIRRALESREWVITRDEPGVIEAKQDKRRYWASIRVTYDARSAQVRYLDSQGLNYAKTGGEERIHSHYNVWARNVEKDLANALSQ